MFHCFNTLNRQIARLRKSLYIRQPNLCTCSQLYFQITLHISYVHAAVNPLLFIALHRALRRAALQLCCGCCVHWSQFVLALTAAGKTFLILYEYIHIQNNFIFKIILQTEIKGL